MDDKMSFWTSSEKIIKYKINKQLFQTIQLWRNWYIDMIYIQFIKLINIYAFMNIDILF